MSELFFKFTLNISNITLYEYPLSGYQKFLIEKIEELRSGDWNDSQISRWMNENGYLTVRGKPFKSNHVWSMRTKFKGRENQFIEGPTFDYEDLRIEIFDLYGKIHTLRDFSEFL